MKYLPIVILKNPESKDGRFNTASDIEDAIRAAEKENKITMIAQESDGWWRIRVPGGPVNLLCLPSDMPEMEEVITKEEKLENVIEKDFALQAIAAATGGLYEGSRK